MTRPLSSLFCSLFLVYGLFCTYIIHTLYITLFTLFARSLNSAFTLPFFFLILCPCFPPAVTVITFCFHSLSPCSPLSYYTHFWPFLHIKWLLLIPYVSSFSSWTNQSPPKFPPNFIVKRDTKCAITSTWDSSAATTRERQFSTGATQTPTKPVQPLAFAAYSKLSKTSTLICQVNAPNATPTPA